MRRGMRPAGWWRLSSQVANRAHNPVRAPAPRPHVWLSLLLAGFVALAVPQPSVVGASALPEFDGWGGSATIAGAAVFTGMTSAEIDTLLTSMINQKVSVIEADSDLSNYLNEAAFAQELGLMRDMATAAHARGLRVGWYYPTLEVLTPKGKNIAQTMAKEHPDWVQLGLDGTPNVFYGAGVVFWVEKDMESAWMSPSSPGYRAYFLDRVRRIAATGVDYLWGMSRCSTTSARTGRTRTRRRRPRSPRPPA